MEEGRASGTARRAAELRGCLLLKCQAAESKYVELVRHRIISNASIRTVVQNARLVVGIAQGSIKVLVYPNRTTDVYVRQQNAFNFFLGAIASIPLAVCHAPDMFTQPCRECFVDAMGLIKGLSRHGQFSKGLQLVYAWTTTAAQKADPLDLPVEDTEQRQQHAEQPFPEEPPLHQNRGGPPEGMWNVQSDIAEQED
ncbi:unnamed protein product [Clonostachys chloroleuca]|uniref:Uncharacterized protein n=1 Tax=Clonostachys chloroleuca TaxID=1926264 RepID=A0AA35QGH2_9HYPO|nr:unnamed protein product [Clonostachys chloroleuca]